jgi:DHA1 family bicyclomycin/chloramphenicol resistance-like MFS transporter
VPQKVKPDYANAIWFRLLLVGLAGIGPFSLNIFKPCLPWIKSDLAAPIEIVQLGLSLSIFAAAIATAVSGAIADRIGRQKVILVSLYLFIIGSIISAIAPTAGWMVFGRVVQAASSSVGLALSRTIIHDVHGEGASAPIIARVTFMVVLGVLLAPAIGGVMIEWVSWRMVFFSCALVGIFLLIPAQLRLKESKVQNEKNSKGSNKPWLMPLLKSPVFNGFAFQSAFHFAIFFSFTSAASYIMVDLLGRRASEYGLWFIVAAIFAAAGLWLAQRVHKRIRSGKLAMVGSVIVFIGCSICATYLWNDGLTPARLFVPAAFASFGIGLALPGTNAGVMEVDKDLAATASGLMGFLQMVVAAIFAQLVVQNEAEIKSVMASILLIGGSLSLLFSFLSVKHGLKFVQEYSESPDLSDSDTAFSISDIKD